jgi:sigma-B regulation protein RsbU (phosphoserine phosphatase)
MQAARQNLEELPGEDIGHVPSDDARILVVDDLKSSRMMIGAVLAAAGFTNLDYAGDGIEALEKIREIKPDLLVLDIVMPRMDGFDVCRKVRQELGHDFPILVQSGITNADERVRVFDEGATDLVSKPINAAELISRVRVHVEHRRLLADLRQYQRRMEDELRTAEAMQVSLMKSDEDVATIAEPRGARIASHYQPSNQLGGDLWQIFPIDDDCFGLLMVDLSGHGVTAAINAFRLHMLIESLTDDRGNPAQWLATLAERLYQLLPVEHFATGFYGVYDRRNRSMVYASGAAPTALVLRNDGRNEELDPSGLLLGVSDDVSYDARTVVFEPGDRLFLYSDALTEDFKYVESSLSETDLANIARQALLDDGLNGFPDRVKAQVFATPEDEMRDDITLILMEAR